MVHQLMTVQEKQKETSCKSFQPLMKRVLRRIHTAVDAPQVQSVVSITIHCDSQTLESLTTLWETGCGALIESMSDYGACGPNLSRRFGHGIISKANLSCLTNPRSADFSNYTPGIYMVYVCPFICSFVCMLVRTSVTCTFMEITSMFLV